MVLPTNPKKIAPLYEKSYFVHYEINLVVMTISGKK